MHFVSASCDSRVTTLRAEVQEIVLQLLAGIRHFSFVC